MASISNDPNGRRRVQFTDGQGNRKTIRLGKISKRLAQNFTNNLEDLIASRSLRSAPAEKTTLWLTGLDDELYEKLHKVGLVSKRGSATLGEFTRTYIDGRADIKPSTRINMNRARAYLLEHFDANKPLRDITEGDAEDWKQHMVRSGRADNTIRKAAGRIRQFFKAAQQRELVSRNPFLVVPAAVKPVHNRFFFVTRPMMDKVLAACPDLEWRLIFSLARYGGVRCPSEVLALTWSDVLWDDDKIRIVSAKTESQGKASRLIPLFPELRDLLLGAFEAAEDGAEHVITRYRDKGVNLRTQAHRIIKRAGLEPWEKVFQNLRSTRETELAETYPLHVVTNWIGNSELVAAKHYLQTTNEHYDRAVNNAAQNAAQKLHEGSGNEPKDEPAGEDEGSVTSAACRDLQESAGYSAERKVPEVGLEPTLCCQNRILNPTRLPIPPLRRGEESIPARL